MKLLLTSDGVSNDSIKKSLLNLVGKDRFKILFIITAANNDEDDDKNWLVNNIFKLSKLGQVDIIDILSFSKEKLIQKINNCDIIAVGGGDTMYLMEAFESTGILEYLKESIVEKNKIYLGISSGSICLAKNIWVSSEYSYDEEDGKMGRSGLGIIDFNFRSHYNSVEFPNLRKDYLEKIAKKNPKETIYALDDDSAVEIIGEKITIITEGTYDIFN